MTGWVDLMYTDKETIRRKIEWYEATKRKENEQKENK